jgi:hypothetical protein
MCFVAVLPMPYSYYIFLRWAVSLAGIALVVALPRTGYWGVALLAAVAAVLFNPLVPVPLERDTWKWADASAGLLFLFFCIVLGIHHIRTSPSLTQESSRSGLDQIADSAASRIKDRARGNGGAQPTEVEDALDVLVEIAPNFDPRAFELVNKRVRASILAQPEAFSRVIRRGSPVRSWVWGAISNAAGDLLESGDFHAYRGVLDPTGPGEGLLRIFDSAADELCRLQAADAQFITRQKAALRENIATVG